MGSPISNQQQESGKKRSSLLKRLRRKLTPANNKAQAPSVQDPESPARQTDSSSESFRTSFSSATGSGFEQVFKYFDENGDGKISAEELRRVLGDHELSPEAAESIISSIDSDGDGLLDQDDFMKLVEIEGDQHLMDAFSVYVDTDAGVAGGCITAKSLHRALESLLGETRTLGDCKAIIGCFDLNGDGVLSFEEFRTMMTMA